jgi:uncharacterized protein (TIGR02246 family)
MTAAGFGTSLAIVVSVMAADGGAKQKSAEEALGAWVAAFRSAKVADMTACYEDSEQVVAIESSGKVRQGAAAIRKMYEEAFAEVEFDEVKLEALQVRESGDVAWATCRLKAETVVRADRSRWTLHVQGSLVLKRDDGGWKIVVEHFSPIAGIPRVQRR